jgi:putative integral membrane protein (TIGR02587 family)
MDSRSPARRASAWQQELHDLVRGILGAFVFGIPLLLTQEMWSVGAGAPTWKLVVLLGAALGGAVFLTRSAGFKRRSTFRNRVDQAVHAVAIGTLAALVTLLTVNRIHLGVPLTTALGMVVVQAVPLSLGASVANVVFAEGERRYFAMDQRREQEERPWRAIVHKVVATVTGGVFVGFSVAPTEEVPLLAAGLTYGHQLAVVTLSLALTHAVLFHSGFRETESPSNGPVRAAGSSRRLVGHIAETGLVYTVALCVALAALFFYNRTGGVPPTQLAAQMLVLGLPATIGGAAGRLVL